MRFPYGERSWGLLGEYSPAARETRFLQECKKDYAGAVAPAMEIE